MKFFVRTLSFLMAFSVTCRAYAEPPHNGDSLEEAKILNRGEVSTGRYVTGGVVGSIAGFGIGHGIQGAGRYRDRGWIFTAGESTFAATFIVGALDCQSSRYANDNYDDYGDHSSCDGRGLMTVGIVGLIGFHIWEVIDLWVEPPRMNSRYRQLIQSRNRAELQVVPAIIKHSPGLMVTYGF